jgi:ribosomal protein S18 acetylase RimI-like enzyme
MSRYQIRALKSEDFDTIMALEKEIFGAAGENLLCPYYVRLCCDFFAQSCFLAFCNGRPVGYLLCFIRNREAYCTTLAIAEDFQRTRITTYLLKEFVRSVVDQVDLCWFTVDEDNKAARALHKMLGAVEQGVRKDFYGAGDDRIVSMIDRERLEMMRPKYERLGLLPRRDDAIERGAA